MRGRQDPNDACLEYTGADYKGECTAVWMQARELQYSVDAGLDLHLPNTCCCLVVCLHRLVYAACREPTHISLAAISVKHFPRAAFPSPDSHVQHQLNPLLLAPDAELAVEPPTLGRMMFCSNFRNATGRLLPMRSWGPGYACQQVTDGSHTCFTSDSHWQAEEVGVLSPYLSSLPGSNASCINCCSYVLFILQVDLADFFDLSTQQCASNLSFTYDYTTDASSPSYVRPRPYEEQAAAAVGYLLPTLYQYGRVVSWYMANASITQNTTRSVSLQLHMSAASGQGRGLVHCTPPTMPDSSTVA